jgi:hypothetical protein
MFKIINKGLAAVAIVVGLSGLVMPAMSPRRPA